MVRMDQTSHSSTLVGWREWVSLPDADIQWVKAKIDTGARSSSLHAHNIVEFERDGVPWVRFDVQPWQHAASEHITVERPIFDRREVRSSSGHTQKRLFVLLDVVLAGERVTAEVTLTNRSSMGFRMLIGREALRRGFIVNPAKSYFGERPSKTLRRRNRGR
ncbi:ribosomal protein S6 modification protein [Microbacterium keratanolyticum]|uniref:Ribosomal protein S6 modification protein n=2 Tax=Microbacterium keratanolyticum TaxID=67574 RepID=A0A9W6M9P1_9MICO|nr:ribosomal protein S6 modification protein [Microbacterium keratanolyticum]